MDLIKIGKYIAGKRKSLGMTQKQLAEKLGITNVVDIRYNEQQPLIAFVYDDDAMSVPVLDDLINSQADFLSKNDSTEN